MAKIDTQLVNALDRYLGGARLALPTGGGLVWQWFLDLCRTRTSNGYGPNPICFSEIEAYARLYRWPLEPRHVDTIMAMDRVWMEHARQLVKNPDKVSRFTAGPGMEMTPDAFDAVFG